VKEIGFKLLKKKERLKDQTQASLIEEKEYHDEQRDVDQMGD